MLNLSGSAVAGAKIAIGGADAGSAKVHGEDRSVEVAADGTLADDFDPFGVHIYLLPAH